MYLGREDYEQAALAWERGLTVEPDYSTNFFRAATIYCQTDARAWGILYGELYINVQSADRRPFQPSAHKERIPYMRQLLWRTYNDAFVFRDELTEDELTSDSDDNDGENVGRVEFFRTATMTVDPETHTLHQPFEFIYEANSMVGGSEILIDGPPLTVARLHHFRSTFLEKWFTDTSITNHLDVPLLDYQRRLQNAGLFEAYDYTLFECKETKDEVAEWFDANQGKREEVTNWMEAHPFPTDTAHAFSRLNAGSVPLMVGNDGEE
jgi:hypothetical protein